MRIKIRTPEIRFTMPIPVPIGLAELAVRAMPNSVFDEMREKTEDPYKAMVSKEMIILIIRECKDIIREYKGLEAVHVECADGTFVSIRL